ncbi:hypothetical protein [Pseudoleptotrichia goodfellowii]|jgi:hypothetical protein|uniref:Uncharacterized protein n=1 Tax=Pseudoleptotrichia goodfellowii TaxID=157692 RepID=A0A510JAN4_9FUSO|nr:hypothetical protein [Pseudoleptotrichia goodfellowii]BBM35461.1 hypothetical protein JCM16774_0374 [Pseudoleptotrichia goodfellowii]
MKIQYKENEIKNLILNNDFVEIPFDFTNLKSKTLKIEAIVFERKIKFELMYINKKYDFLFDSIENVVFQIFNVDNELLSTSKLQLRQDLLFAVKQITNDYDDLILLLIPKNKKSLKDKSFSLENIENYGFFLFKEVKNG